MQSSGALHVVLAGDVFITADLVGALRAREPRATAALVAELRADAARERPTHEGLRIAIDAFGPGVRAYLSRVRPLHDHERESAYVETFLRMTRDIAAFDPGIAPFAGWLVALTRSAALAEYEPHRKRQRQERAHEEHCREIGRRLRVGPAVDDDHVVAAIRLLSPLKQRVLYGRAVLERSFADLAAAERRGLAAVERLYVRAATQFAGAALARPQRLTVAGRCRGGNPFERALTEVRTNYARLQAEGGDL